ncbi:MAG: sulfite exporter TauE/SafE family protein [Bacteroidia bacterium]|nr:sulfite exporter TauE/SafE family protein [Bacteroidia bacterium]MDW8134957.1 sulfite exporter TauE/SafE family protein [Bacteroidia bacterium]
MLQWGGEALHCNFVFFRIMSGLSEWAIGFALGLLSGVISGLVGIGGGTIIIPLLVLIMGYTQHVAQGTALLAFALPVFGWAAWNYYKHGRVDGHLALGVAGGIAVSSFFVARWVQEMRSELLTQVFAVFLIVVSVWQFWRAGRSFSFPSAGEGQKKGALYKVMWGLIIGLAAGALKGLTGLGGGVIIVPLLVLLVKVDQHMAQGTSLLTMTLPVSFMAVIPYWQKGNVMVGVAFALALGILVGSAISSRIAQRIAGPHLARLFAITIFGIGVFLLYS